jgi:hypothetical protein
MGGLLGQVGVQIAVTGLVALSHGPLDGLCQQARSMLAWMSVALIRQVAQAGPEMLTDVDVDTHHGDVLLGGGRYVADGMPRIRGNDGYCDSLFLSATDAVVTVKSEEMLGKGGGRRARGG